jgi:hypothetical protein
MDHITLAGLDPHQLAELETRIKHELEKTSAQIGAQNIATDSDVGGWYQLAMGHAASIVALAFRQARGE